MSFDTDDEILQDFLLEAGEILEQLSEQLVDLEQSPQDNELLNAVFRGFHTIKGGAGFLNLTALVDVCHRAEDIFNLLRQGEKQIDSHLMDIMLRVIDVLNVMFDEVRSAQEPTPAEAELLQQLEELKSNETVVTPEQDQIPAPVESDVTSELAENSNDTLPASEDSDTPNTESEKDITDEEFEMLLSALDSGENEEPEKVEEPAPANDDISDDEFEALLDQIHGAGQHTEISNKVEESGASQPASTESDEISDDEFEHLLDQIHGEGKHGTTASSEQLGTPQEPAQPATIADSENITDDEFDALLDEIHGKNKINTDNASNPAVDTPVTEASAATIPESVRPAPQPAVKKLEPASAAKPAEKKPSKEAIHTETTVRVDTKRLDDIMNLVGELVLVRNRLSTLEEARNDEEVSKAVANLDLVTADLQTSVMKTRMQPIKKVFGRFPRVVRDLARNLKKEINLEMTGEETDLDKNLVEALADPLVHLVRNAVDHGIEDPETREKTGKSRVGTVVLSASQEGDHILLSISDDGAGMDPDFLRNIAVEKGLYDEDSASRLDDSECYNLIFMPGFSSKKEISDVSGRGVGMDVVKTRIMQLNGSVEIDSDFGNGSKIIIKVPLTLAIMPTLMIRLAAEVFAFPLVSVSEIFDYSAEQTNTVDGQLVVMVRNKAVPLYFLRNWLIQSQDASDAQDGYVVLANVANKMVGFVVDQLIGQEEVVIKPLGALLHGTKGLAGATITGDGQMALILDIPGLLRAYARKQ